MLDSISGLGRQRAQYLTARLYALAREAYPYDLKESITIEPFREIYLHCFHYSKNVILQLTTWKD